MSKPEWGVKRICPSCGTKYYDFNKTPIICPNCNFKFDPDLLLKSRKGRGFSSKLEEVNENVKMTSKDSEEKNKENVIAEEEIIDIDEDLDNEIESESNAVIEEEIDEGIEVEDGNEIPFLEEDINGEEISVEIEDDDKNNN